MLLWEHLFIQMYKHFCLALCLHGQWRAEWVSEKCLVFLKWCMNSGCSNWVRMFICINANLVTWITNLGVECIVNKTLYIFIHTVFMMQQHWHIQTWLLKKLTLILNIYRMTMFHWKGGCSLWRTSRVVTCGFPQAWFLQANFHLAHHASVV